MEKLPTLWIAKYKIKTETGLPLTFKNHTFLYDIYNDLSPLQAILKAPQIGATLMETIKSLWVAKKLKKDIIYTLPTQNDVEDMAGGKVNRIIAQNPILQQWVKEHDTVEQKTVGDNIVYYRGTWTNKQAMMVSSGLNLHDEVDASKQEVIEQYETRLQAQASGWRWYFSHPSLPGIGVDKYWQQSDQKHWFVKCEACNERQYLSWPDSIQNKQYVCKECKKILSVDVIRRGEWIKKYNDRAFSGYWISQLMCPWITAAKIIDDYENKTEDYFYNYVLGLPHIGSNDKLTKDLLMQNLTGNKTLPSTDERIVIGIDTGLRLDYVMGSGAGLFYAGDCKDYGELDEQMQRWPKAMAVIDAGGDLIGSRAFKERWPGRVFLCYTGGDRKNTDEPVWNDDERMVTASRDKTIQLVIDEFRDKRIPLQGVENDWYNFWLDVNNVHRVRVLDPLTQVLKGFKWVRDGRDHLFMATVYWRIGMMKFGGGLASIIGGNKRERPTSPTMNPDGTSDTTYMEVFKKLRERKQGDWRKI